MVVGVKADCLSRDLGLWVECPPWKVFQRDSSPYLSKFRRKPRKTPNGKVDKRDRGMNLAPPIYHFLSAVTGEAKDGQLDIHDLPGIRTRDLWSSNWLPYPLHHLVGLVWMGGNLTHITTFLTLYIQCFYLTLEACQILSSIEKMLDHKFTCRVLTFFYTQSIHLLPWPAISRNMSPIESIMLWVAKD